MHLWRLLLFCADVQRVLLGALSARHGADFSMDKWAGTAVSLTNMQATLLMNASESCYHFVQIPLVPCLEVPTVRMGQTL